MSTIVIGELSLELIYKMFVTYHAFALEVRILATLWLSTQK
jgi:hypothetical protein